MASTYVRAGRVLILLLALAGVASGLRNGATALARGMVRSDRMAMVSRPNVADGAVPDDSPPPGVDPAYWQRPGVWDEKDLGTLLDANRAWSRRMVAEKPTFFEEVKQGHAPRILWIGCSDARVPVNEMIGEPPGSVFVHRNIANLVVNTDFNCLSVIQYAVDVLKVKHIVVCGHYDCGGVKAALTNTDHRSPLENWLRNIRDTYRLHKDELDEISDQRLRQRRLVELNVIEQCLNVFKTAVVQRRRVLTHNAAKEPGSLYTFAEPVVHAFVYEPTTGTANKLKVDFKKYLRELSDVYDLYNHEANKSILDAHDLEEQCVANGGDEECVVNYDVLSQLDVAGH